MTLFASFVTVADAERAAAALLDRGARKDDLNVVAHVGEHGSVQPGDADDVAKHGLTTTTGADAAMGAAKGMGVGMGLGILGAIAALTVPGVGLVLGAGAATLAAAVGGTVAAGAATGGLIGYLKDQGMGEEVAAEYHARVAAGGAMLSLATPSGDLAEIEAESLLRKYGAVGVFTSYPSTTDDVAPLPVAAPHVVPSEPLETLTPVTPTFVEVPTSVIVTRNDPVTGEPAEGYVDEASTGLRRFVRFDRGRPYFDNGLAPVHIPPTTTPSVAAQPVTVTTVAPAVVTVSDEVPIAAVTPTRSDPATGLAVEGFVEDPLTGVRRPVRFEHGRAYYIA